MNILSKYHFNHISRLEPITVDLNRSREFQSALKTLDLYFYSTFAASSLSPSTPEMLTKDSSIINKIESMVTMSNKHMNCSFEESYSYSLANKQCAPVLRIINYLIYVLISIGIVFNILNLIVLLNSKLNESPYTYLTSLAFSDLGALFMIAIDKIRQSINQSSFSDNLHIYLSTPLTNIFVSSSMYITLALTIERFIFVHSPLKAISICRKSTARRICLAIFVFSLLRFIYLPFMYKRNCSGGFSQEKNKMLDIYEFLIGSVVPYSIIFVANISLIFSLNKQNNKMIVSNSISNGSSVNNSSANKTESYRTLKKNNNLIGKSSHSHENHPMIKCKKNSYDIIYENENLKKTQQHKQLKPAPKSKISFNFTAITKKDTKRQDSRETGKTSRSNELKEDKLYRRTSNLREIRNQKKLTATLVIILCLLLICYSPSLLFEETFADLFFGSHENASESKPESIRAYKIKLVGNEISKLLIYLNCSSNFLIYCLCNKKFKNSLKFLFKKSFLNRYFHDALHFSSNSCVQKDELHTINRIASNAKNDLNKQANKYHLTCEHDLSNESAVVRTPLQNYKMKKNFILTSKIDEKKHQLNGSNNLI